MGGFIVLEDGRAYAASNVGTDAVLRAAACFLEGPLRSWLLRQQSTYVGSGLTRVDLREVAPQQRPLIVQALRQAHEQAVADSGFEEFTTATPRGESWISYFGDLIAMIDKWELGEDPLLFNPHMRELLLPTGRKVGPGWSS